MGAPSAQATPLSADPFRLDGRVALTRALAKLVFAVSLAVAGRGEVLPMTACRGKVDRLAAGAMRVDGSDSTGVCQAVRGS